MRKRHIIIATAASILGSSFLFGCHESESTPRGTGMEGKGVNLVSGIGVPSRCECGMRLTKLLRQIGTYAKYHDVSRSEDIYVKYAWGLEIDQGKRGDRARVDTLLFWVQPVEWCGTNELSCVPDFSSERSLFRGTVDGVLDFSSGKVTANEVMEKYGDCQMVFQQGEPFHDVEGFMSFKILLVNGEVGYLNYRTRGIQFGFRNGFVDSILIFRPCRVYTRDGP